MARWLSCFPFCKYNYLGKLFDCGHIFCPSWSPSPSSSSFYHRPVKCIQMQRVSELVIFHFLLHSQRLVSLKAGRGEAGIGGFGTTILSTVGTASPPPSGEAPRLRSDAAREEEESCVSDCTPWSGGGGDGGLWNIGEAERICGSFYWAANRWHTLQRIRGMGWRRPGKS